jgi:hypothetical protein
LGSTDSSFYQEANTDSSILEQTTANAQAVAKQAKADAFLQEIKSAQATAEAEAAAQAAEAAAQAAAEAEAAAQAAAEVEASAQAAAEAKAAAQAAAEAEAIAQAAEAEAAEAAAQAAAEAEAAAQAAAEAEAAAQAAAEAEAAAQAAAEAEAAVEAVAQQQVSTDVVSFSWEQDIQVHPKDADGWSILKPDTETRIFYISSSDGNDETARPYLSGEILNPFNPSSVLAYKTIDKAISQLRDNKPDWVLFKKGDVFELTKTIYIKSGKSATAHKVFAAYGGQNKRPVIDTNDLAAINMGKSESFITIKDLEFYPSKLDPNSVEFLGWENITARQTGFLLVPNEGEPAGYIHLENNRFSYYGNNISLYGPDKDFQNVVVRRNEILNAYSPAAHSQGIVISGAHNVLVEENVLDHNGWYKQRPIEVPANKKDFGYATVFNHNGYLSGLSNFIFRNNLVSRASSIGLKLASNSYGNTNEINFKDAVINDNLFIEGEVGTSIGGNGDQNDGPRWQNINLIGNIFSEIGRAQPTNRNIAWNVEIDDWTGGSVKRNYMTGQISPSITNRKAIGVTGINSVVEIKGNKTANLSISGEDYFSNSLSTNLTVENNDYIQNTGKSYLSDYLINNTIQTKYDDFINYKLGLMKEDMRDYFDVKPIISYIKQQVDFID